MGEELERRRRLDRRGFLGAAAGVAAAGATATAMGPWASKGTATGPECAEHAAEIPKIRRGAIHYTLPAAAWNTEAAFLDSIGVLQVAPHQRLGVRGRLPDGRRHQPQQRNHPVPGAEAGRHPNPRAGMSGWEAFGSYANAYGFRLVGDARRPRADLGGEPRQRDHEDERVELQPARRRRRLPGRRDQPAGRRDGDHESARDLGVAGERGDDEQLGPGVPDRQRRRRPRQHGLRRRVSSRGRRSPSGRACARYYRHFHSEQGKWIQNTGTKYDGHYISELVYTETDAAVAFAQSDQCWLLDGLWMAGGSAPSVGLQGPGDPNPGQGKNRLVAAGPDRALAGQGAHVPHQGPGPERPGHAGRERRRQRTPRRGDVPVRGRPVGAGPGHGSVPADPRAVPAPASSTSTCSSATARAARSRAPPTGGSSTCRRATCSTRSCSTGRARSSACRSQIPSTPAEWAVSAAT